MHGEHNNVPQNACTHQTSDFKFNYKKDLHRCLMIDRVRVY